MTTLLFIIGGLLTDQLTKHWASSFLSGTSNGNPLLVLNTGYIGYTMPLINNILHFTYAENRGAAFGIFQHNVWIFAIISTIAFIGIICLLYIYKPKTRFFRISLIFMAIGSGGNLIDRLFRGYVIDFIDFRVVNFAIFNVADICISTSAVLLIICMLFLKKEPILHGVLKDPIPSESPESK